MSKSPPPIILLPPSNVTAAPKSNIALDCLSHNATTRWYKDGKLVLTGSGRLQLLSSGSLKINNLQVQIVGIFATFWNWQQLHAYLINLSTRINLLQKSSKGGCVDERIWLLNNSSKEHFKPPHLWKRLSTASPSRSCRTLVQLTSIVGTVLGALP